MDYKHTNGNVYRPIRKLFLAITPNGHYELNLKYAKICYLNKAVFEKSLLEHKNAFYVLYKGGKNGLK